MPTQLWTEERVIDVITVVFFSRPNFYILKPAYEVSYCPHWSSSTPSKMIYPVSMVGILVGLISTGIE